MATSLHGKTHNFGIFQKNGKRAVLQLDFPGTSVYLIKRGHIKKTFLFDNLEHFDSEEGLHIALKFKEGIFEFDADNSEEKYTICRLLSLILNADEEDAEDPSTPTDFLAPTKIIKEGLIEKKGNTTITTWNKRRLQIGPGEFSYYKPGDQLALNIIQVWSEICHLKKVGQGSFIVKVREREYVFRVVSDSRAAAESEREQWMRAFHVALRSKRSTLMVLDSLSLPTLRDDDSPNQSETSTFTFPQKSVLSQPNGHLNHDSENESETGDVEHRIPDKPGLTAHVSVHLSYFDNTDTLEHLPTASRPKPPAYQVKKSRQGHTDLTDSPNHEKNVLEKTEITDEHSQSVASVRAKWQTIGNRVSNEIKENKIQINSHTKETKVCFKEPKPDYDDGGIQDKNKNKMADAKLNNVDNNNVEPKQHRTAPPPPATTASIRPAPPPLSFKSKKTGVKLKYIPKMKLKQVHWTRIPQMLVAQTLWKDVRDVTERLDRAHMDVQFSQSDKDLVPQTPKATKRDILIDTKRAQNLGILFAGLKEDVIDQLKNALQSTVEVPEFPADKLRTIRRYQPTVDDMEMYKEYKGSRDSLLAVDRFMMDMCDIAYLGPRLDLVLTILDLPTQFSDLSQEVSLVWKACEELYDCPPLVGVLEYLLSVGNYLNAYSSAGIGAHGFQITSIDKVLDIKGRVPHYTLLHLLVEQIRQTEPSLLDWTSRLPHVTRSADFSVIAITAEVEVLKNDLHKIRRNMKTLKPILSAKQDKKFYTNVQNFLIEYDRKLVDLQASSTKLLELYHKTLVLFGEPAQTSSDVFFSSISYFMEKFQTVRDKQS